MPCLHRRQAGAEKMPHCHVRDNTTVAFRHSVVLLSSWQGQTACCYTQAQYLQVLLYIFASLCFNMHTASSASKFMCNIKISKFLADDAKSGLLDVSSDFRFVDKQMDFSSGKHF